MKAVIVSNAASTSTGNFPASTFVDLGGSASLFGIATVHASTKQVAWTLQGDIAGAGAWTNLVAATSSTGSTIAATTAGIPVTRLRINVSGNGSTGDVTTRWFITA